MHCCMSVTSFPPGLLARLNKGTHALALCQLPGCRGQVVAKANSSVSGGSRAPWLEGRSGYAWVRQALERSRE